MPSDKTATATSSDVNPPGFSHGGSQGSPDDVPSDPAWAHFDRDKFVKTVRKHWTIGRARSSVPGAIPEALCFSVELDIFRSHYRLVRRALLDVTCAARQRAWSYVPPQATDKTIVPQGQDRFAESFGTIDYCLVLVVVVKIPIARDKLENFGRCADASCIRAPRADGQSCRLDRRFAILRGQIPCFKQITI